MVTTVPCDELHPSTYPFRASRGRITIVPCDELHPSQLYISAQKMRDVVEWFDFDDPAHDALPTYILDGNLTLSDGHTRAFVTYFGGVDSLRIQELGDSDTEELNLELYRECLDWVRRRM